MPLLWAYLTGVCHLAAGASMITRLWMPLGTFLIGLMFFLFVGLLHVPRVARDWGNPHEWISLFVAVAFCAGAWLLASQAHALSRASAYTAPLYRPIRLLRNFYHRPAAL
jgi:protein-S-isoprenylcysteine O-methyltransferase Ste14